MMSAKGNSHQENICFLFSSLACGTMLRLVRVTGDPESADDFRGKWKTDIC